ncbi:50S ribosomal protein L3 N(5)-glutamine methyltransferase [Nitrosomonas nitrosa]|uniref:50S ribosomal protein L3 N(5)-glutamine methyltransferase n=1 Tax=Nitrosomonas nitrosa TaxID=52442 RepID=UPI0023F981EB|nr:50S ribosomal protein L3 N(5)-glutamine methyltransferase [Nitrosomonas nitrosa]MCO6435324.1 50S ribosomal protein L3 N(5)-glutamine methyltransferase [Nitrosomonas nitrosa]
MVTPANTPDRLLINHASSELRTLRDWLRFTVSYFNQADLFFGHGFATAYDEATHLILHTLHLAPDQLTLFLDARLTQIERDQIVQLILQRVTEKIPVAYLTHEAWLGDFSFYVDKRVIIPRSFIAELLQTRLAPWISQPEGIHTALDLCTGSGCLAILLAHAFENARIDAVDISPDALDVARKNIERYDLVHVIRPIQSDLFSALAGQRYDVIISNPPYVNAASMATLPDEYHHEPNIALAGGQDGLTIIHNLLKEAANYLTENGLLIVEIGHNREVLEQSFPRIPFTWLETSGGDQFVFMLERKDLI